MLEGGRLLCKRYVGGRMCVLWLAEGRFTFRFSVKEAFIAILAVRKCTLSRFTVN